MKWTLLGAIIVVCGFAVFSCESNDDNGDSGECPAPFHLKIESLEIFCDDARADYKEEEGYLEFEIVGNGDNVAAAIAILDVWGAEEDEGEWDERAQVLWECDEGEGDMDMDMKTYVLDIEESNDRVSGTLTGTFENGDQVAACWTDLRNTTL